MSNTHARLFLIVDSSVSVNVIALESFLFELKSTLGGNSTVGEVGNC